ncbi:unnamed protein product [Chironomus riparius]|uniref:DUF243 domain-containing protein n=1 Tax=Chironomus riparius TaxID=315576 RepID=A0A9N9S1K2_9DIPT|nr:unnamed protein product [Chironomus riparius]
MKLILILSVAFAVVNANPEPPVRARQSLPYPPPPAPALLQQLPRQIVQNGPPQIPLAFPPSAAINAPRDSYGTPAQSYGPPPQQPIITKNVYVHLPPDDEEDIRQPQVIQPQAPRKHYKLIFIKAPEPPRYTAPTIPPTPQDEHKTLVYVLVKKPEEQPQIELPSVAPTEPSKPEVYFIKYKAQENKPAQGYGPPSPPPKPEYGPPPPPNGDYGAPSF